MEIRRIDLSAVTDLESAIKNISTTLRAAGYLLASSFVYGNQLILLYQQPL